MNLKSKSRLDKTWKLIRFYALDQIGSRTVKQTRRQICNETERVILNDIWRNVGSPELSRVMRLIDQ